MLKLFRVGGLLALVAGVAAVLAGLPHVMSGIRDFHMVDAKLQGQDFLTALQKLKPEDIAAFETRETQAYLKEPLDMTAMQNLVLLAGLKKDLAKQEQLALLLPRYSKRIVSIQMAASNILLGKRDYDGGLLEMDALLKAHPEVGPDVFPVLVAVAAQKDGVKALAKVLVPDPPWRWSFIRHAILADPEAQAAYTILAAIRQEKGEVHVYEIRQLVATLVRAGKIDKAYFIWLDFLKDDDLRLVQSVFDGNFDRDSQNMQFDWTITPRKNARIAIENRRGSSVDRNLVLDFASDKGVFANVKQLLVLSPGDYAVTLEYMGQNLKAEKGLVWIVRCANGSVLGRSGEFKSSGPWAQYGFAFKIPEESCPTQNLSLESSSRAVLDTPISGQMYFDSIKIQAPTPPASVQDQQ